MNGTIDFIIIGAQKGGTTTLFKLLGSHPGVYMPPEKEAPFFTFDDRYDAGLPAYLEEFFSGAPADRLWGKATPHYLSDPRAAARIRETLPGVKLVAILRNPIERALSHYKMALRRGDEHMPFDDAASALLVPGEAARARELTTDGENETSCYLAWGEYGRLIERFYSLFDAGSILVLFTEELSERPGEVLSALTSFLSLDEFTPENLGARYHVGGTRERLPFAKKIVHYPPIRRLWHSVPGRLRRPVNYWFNQYNVIKGSSERLVLTGETRKRLVEFFAPDVRLLERLTGLRVPWEEFRTSNGKGV